MRKLVLLVLLLAVTTPASAAPPGSAQNFLDRAHRLKSKGPFAFFDSDYGRLKAEATTAGKAIGDDRIAAEKREADSLLFAICPGRAWQLRIHRRSGCDSRG